MSVLDDLGQYLEDQGVAELNETLWIGSRPDDKDPLLALYQYPGAPPEYVQENRKPIAEYPRVQVVARAIKYEDAETLIYAAWDALSGIANQDLSGTHYRSIRPDSSPAFMGRDVNDRILMFFNAAVDKEINIAVVS